MAPRDFLLSEDERAELESQLTDMHREIERLAHAAAELTIRLLDQADRANFLHPVESE